MGYLVVMLGYLGHLSGMIISKTGLFLQKKTHIELERREIAPSDGEFVRYEHSSNKKPVYCHCIWWIGFWMIIIGGGMQVGVLPWVDLVLISTNSITAIAFNTFLAVRYLNEKMNWKYDMPAFTLMGIGGFIIVMLANAQNKTFTSQEIVDLLTSKQSLIFASLAVIFLAGTILQLLIFLKQIK